MIQKKPRGRKPGVPSKQVNWEEVDHLLRAHCTAEMIAATLGIHTNTLLLRCQKDKNCLFSEYSQRLQAEGKSVALRVQYEMMQEKCCQAMIWWCTNHLGQSSKVKQEIETKQEITQKVILKLPDNGNRVARNDEHSQ